LNRTAPVGLKMTREERIQEAQQMLKVGQQLQEDRLKQDQEDERVFAEAVSFILGPEAIDAGEDIATLSRVTTQKQVNKGSLQRQMAALRQEVEKRGATVPVQAEFWKAPVEGYSEEWLEFVEGAFREVARQGIKKIAIAVLSRLLRSPDYSNDNPHAMPSVEQLARIERLADKYGLKIVSILAPDSDFRQERSHQTKRSGRAGRPKGTRNQSPYWCKEQRERFAGIAVKAYQEVKSYRKAAEIVNKAIKKAGCFVRRISHETVRQWVMASKGNSR
jgi:hypothetical protein